ncbi:hypothetical protein [Serratia fonticola]
MFNTHESFVQYVIDQSSAKVRSYSGTNLIGVLYSIPSGAIVVVWSNHKASNPENYIFPIVGREEFFERSNNEEDFAQEAEDLVNRIYAFMVAIDADQNGKPLNI